MSVRSDYPPLHHAHILPSSRHQVAVVVQEGHVGHVTAVATVNMAGSLQRKDNLKRKCNVFTELSILILPNFLNTYQNRSDPRYVKIIAKDPFLLTGSKSRFHLPYFKTQIFLILNVLLL